MSVAVILGCMFSGKTEELMRRVGRYKAIGWHVLVVNSTHDTRCGKAEVQSHAGEVQRAVKVEKLRSVVVGANKVIAVDEAQFFDDLQEVVAGWAEGGIHVLVSGLNGDYRGNAFGQILNLIPTADEVVWKTAYCAVCCDGTPASFSKRVDEQDTRTLVVGGKEKYKAVCRKHR
jgi:thymidine kinase